MTTMKKRNNYQDIKTLDELDAVIRQSRARIEAQGHSVQNSLVEVQEFYTPRNLAGEALRRFALEHHLYTIAINAVSGLKHFLEK